jgi:hypothetical protein
VRLDTVGDRAASINIFDLERCLSFLHPAPDDA